MSDTNTAIGDGEQAGQSHESRIRRGIRWLLFAGILVGIAWIGVVTSIYQRLIQLAQSGSTDDSPAIDKNSTPYQSAKLNANLREIPHPTGSDIFALFVSPPSAEWESESYVALMDTGEKIHINPHTGDTSQPPHAVDTQPYDMEMIETAAEIGSIRCHECDSTHLQFGDEETGSGVVVDTLITCENCGSVIN